MFTGINPNSYRNFVMQCTELKNVIGLHSKKFGTEILIVLIYSIGNMDTVRMANEVFFNRMKP